MKDHGHDLKTLFWDRLGDVTAGMLETAPGRVIPMSPYADQEVNGIWFITADGSDAYKAAAEGRHTSFTVADRHSKLYSRVEGDLKVVDDKDKLDELWSPVAAAWFDDGREDPHVRLVCLSPQNAEVWATEGGAGFLYEIAKANVSDTTPDAGEHGRVTF